MNVREFFRDCPRDKPIAITVFDTSPDGVAETVSCVVEGGKLPQAVFDKYKDRDIDNTSYTLVPHIILFLEKSK